MFILSSSFLSGCATKWLKYQIVSPVDMGDGSFEMVPQVSMRSMARLLPTRSQLGTIYVHLLYTNVVDLLKMNLR